MRFEVETWAPDYGAPAEAAAAEPAATLDPSSAEVDTGLEVPAASWRPRRPASTGPAVVSFVDGVRRVDARVWIGDGAVPRPGICASYAAGIVDCGGDARVARAEVRRVLLTASGAAEAIVTPAASWDVAHVAGDTDEALSLGLQARMGELEQDLARDRGCDGSLLVIDGPLTGRQSVPGAVGYVKTHRVAYLPAEVSGVVAQLAVGERTPLFVTTTSWSRISWYLRLPGPGRHGWAGVVRCEISADRELPDAVALADRVTAVLPRFASAGHKDARAPQNLVPIGALERALRRRLGDPALLERALRSASAAT